MGICQYFGSSWLEGWVGGAWMAPALIWDMGIPGMEGLGVRL